MKKGGADQALTGWPADYEKNLINCKTALSLLII